MAKLGTPQNPLRVGVFQLGYHPSVTVAGRSALDDPLGHLDPDSSLTALSACNLTIAECLQDNRVEYLKWSEERCQQLINWLQERLDPPHIVVLPEFSVPFEHLDLFFNCSKSTGIVFFAGTHSLQHGVVAQLTYKRQLNVGAQALTELINRKVRSVLPVFDNGKTTLIAKLSPSPFEQDECEEEPGSIVQREVLSLSINVSVAPMICADAMRLSSWPQSKPPDLAIIVAYDFNPPRFQKYIQLLVETQVPVVFANAASHGGSGVFAAVDRRAPHWWWLPPNRGQLPFGDAYLEVSLNLSSRAVQVNTTIPATPAKLHRLSQIITAGSAPEQTETHAFDFLSREDENGLNAMLNGMDGREQWQQLFLRRWKQLHAVLRNHGPISEWRGLIGESITLSEIFDLPTLESQFCTTAVERLGEILADADSSSTPPDILGRMSTLMARFKKAGKAKPTLALSDTLTSVMPIGRVESLADVRQFVSSPYQHLMVVTGLEAVGKSAAIGPALQQSAARCIRITCNEGTTGDFIYEYLIRAAGGIPAGSAPRTVFPEENIAEAISRFDVLWIENIHQLTEYGAWRDETLRDLITAILEQSMQLRRKCILESRRTVPATTNVGIQVVRKRIPGLPLADAVAHFEGQLRRAGVPVETVDLETRKRIASAVDGHPGLLNLCAEACAATAASKVAHDLDAKRGNIAAAAERILAQIQLSDDARLALDLLSECREPLPYLTLGTVISHKTIVSTIQELTSSCLVDQSRGDSVEATGIVKALHWLDRRATDDQRIAFHHAASEYFASKKRDDDQIIRFKAAIEANYHAILAGEPPSTHMDSLIDAMVAVARRAVNDEEWVRVIAILRPLENGELSAELLAMLAVAYAWSNDFDSAFRVADRALAKSRMHIDVFGTICRAALPQRRLDDAERALRQLEEAEPGTYQVHVLRGRLSEQTGKYEVALGHFQKAAELTDSDAWPFFYYSRALIERGRHDDALEAIDRGLNLVHTKGSLFGSRAVQNALLSQQLMALVFSGDAERAKKVLESLDSVRNARPEVIVCAAYMKASLGIIANDSRALSAFEEALSRLNADQSKKRHTRAQIHFFRGRLHEAMNDLGKAETEFNLACQTDIHNVHMKVCLLKVLMKIARGASSAANSVAAESAALRASEVSKQILRYDSQQKDAQYAQEDIYREFGID